MKTSGDAAIAQLYAALEASDGNPVDLTVKSAGRSDFAQNRDAAFCDADGGQEVNFLGMIPRAMVVGLNWIILRRWVRSNPATPSWRSMAAPITCRIPRWSRSGAPFPTAGDKDLKVSLTVLDPGQTKPHVAEDLSSYRLPDGGGRMGLGIALGCDEMHLVVARTLDESPGQPARFPPGQP